MESFPKLHAFKRRRVSILENITAIRAINGPKKRKNKNSQQQQQQQQQYPMQGEDMVNTWEDDNVNYNEDVYLDKGELLDESDNEDGENDRSIDSERSCQSNDENEDDKRDRDLEYGDGYHDDNDGAEEDDAESTAAAAAAHPTFRLEVGGCDVNNDILQRLTALQERAWCDTNLSDDTTSLYPSSPFSTKAFAVEFRAVSSSNVLSIKAQNDILALLKTHIPIANFPVRYTKSGSFVSDVNKYVGEDHNTLIFGTCPIGCTVFTGNNSTLMKCTVCQRDRFTPCTKKSCKSAIGPECHHLINRTQREDLYYSPLTCTLYRLLQRKGFVKALNFQVHKPSQSGKYKYMDASDGSVFMESMSDMAGVFQQRCTTANWAPGSRIPVSIVLSLFYDGAQVYQTKWSNFSPLLVGIQNLPPTHRSVVGVGIFLCSLFTGKKDSGSERFLFDQCLREELRTLGKGIEMDVGGTLYFLQVRLKLYILDTKGAESYFHVECCNSTHGCPWCGFHGLFSGKNKLNKCIYCGHRWFLPLSHYLRSFGNSQMCCPEIYYPKDGEFELSKKDRAAVNHKRTTQMFSSKRKANRKDNLGVRRIDTGHKFRPCCGMVNVEALKTFLDNDEAPYEFFHEGIRFVDDIAKHLHYQHCDYRAQREYCRRPNQICVQWAESAERVGHSIMGFKAIWEMTQLPFSNLEDVTDWEPMHPMSNVAKNTILEMKGERAAKGSGMRAYCEATDTHYPYMHACGENESPPYLLSELQQFWIDACIDCLLVAAGYSEHFNIRSIFEHTGKLRSADKIKVIRVLLNYFCYCCGHEYKGYREYYKMLSADFCEVSAPFFSEEELKLLHLQIVETVCVHEGLFPGSESLITYHQLIHFVKFIKKWGPLNGWSAMAYERVIHHLKKGVPHGGSNAKKTTFARYSCFEREQTKNGYNGEEHEINNKLQQHLQNPKLMKRTVSGFCYDPFGVYLSKRVDTQPLCTLKKFERTSLLLMLFDASILFSGGDLRNAFARSALCRLYVAFDSHVRSKLKLVVSTCEFLEFIEEVLALRTKKYSLLKNVRSAESFEEYIVDYETELDEYDHCMQIRNTDLSACASLCCDLNVTCYNEATIYGIDVKARGCLFREMQPSTQHNRYGQVQQQTQYRPSNELNSLKDRWWHAGHSSWLRYSILGKEEIRYGQFNFGFRLHLPGDKLLHNTAIASVVSRIPDKRLLTSHRIAAIRLKTTVKEPLFNFDPNILFIPIVQCFSTSILVGGLDDKRKPFNINSKRISPRGRLHCSKASNNEIDHLILLELHPERRKLSFDIDAFNNGDYNNTSRDT